MWMCSLCWTRIIASTTKSDIRTDHLAQGATNPSTSTAPSPKTHKTASHSTSTAAQIVPPTHKHMAPPQRSAIAGRVYLYSNLMLNTVAWAAQHTFGRMCGTRRHPMGWSAEQDFHVMLLRVLFTHGTYVHWRNFMAVAQRLVGKKEQQGLVLERVASGTFGVPGCRSSWWLSLDPSESKEAPPVKASCVLLYLHGGWCAAGFAQLTHVWMGV